MCRWRELEDQQRGRGDQEGIWGCQIAGQSTAEERRSEQNQDRMVTQGLSISAPWSTRVGVRIFCMGASEPTGISQLSIPMVFIMVSFGGG